MSAERSLNDDDAALRILENVYDGGDASDELVDTAAIARMRSAIDRAFDLSWRRVHARAEAEVTAEANARAAVPRVRNVASRSREALLARLLELREMLGMQVQVAYRNSRGEMSDEDLRALVDDLEKAAARRDPVR